MAYYLQKGAILQKSWPAFFSPNLQLFDEDNPLHKSDNKYIFTTEGHVVPIDKRFREKQWSDVFPCEDGVLMDREEAEGQQPHSNFTNVRPGVPLSLSLLARAIFFDTLRLASQPTQQCSRIPVERRFALPLKSVYMRQIDHMVGLS